MAIYLIDDHARFGFEFHFISSFKNEKDKLTIDLMQ